MNVQKYQAIIGTHMVWATALILSALYLNILQMLSIATLLPLLAWGLFPAVTGLIFVRLYHQLWAQLLICFAWLSLAIVASLHLGFLPQALLFLCPPVIIWLMDTGKVMEVFLISLLNLAAIYTFYAMNISPPLSHETDLTLAPTLFICVLSLLISAMIFNPSQSSFASSDSPSSMTNFDPPLLDALPFGLLHFNDQGNLIYNNSRARFLLGLSGKIRRYNLENILSQDNMAQQSFTALCSKAKTQTTILQERLSVHISDDKTIEYTLTATPIRDSLLIILREDNAYYADLDAFENAKQKKQTQTLFLSGINHQLRIPLNAIIGFTDMMRSRLFGPLPNKYAEYTELIHTSAQHMLDLITDVLNISKININQYTLNYSPVNFYSIVTSCVKILCPAAESAHIKFDIVQDKQPDFAIQADRWAIRQIILNLLDQALNSSHPHQSIRIKIDRQHEYAVLNISFSGCYGAQDITETHLLAPLILSQSVLLSDSLDISHQTHLIQHLARLHDGKINIKQKDTDCEIYLQLPLKAQTTEMQATPDTALEEPPKSLSGVSPAPENGNICDQSDQSA